MIQAAIIFIMGLLFGSFANVCIWRIPRREEIVFRPSHCPACQSGIRWYDNIPVLSYFLLRGRCRSCRGAIHWRYPLVETMGGLLFLAAYLKFGSAWSLAGYLPFLWILLVISAIDLEHYIIPDALSLPGTALGLLLAGLASLGLPFDLTVFGRGDVLSRWPLLDSSLGVVLGGGLLWLVAWAGERAFRQEAMGGGDIKLAAMIGAFLGWKAVPIAFLLGSLAGSLIGIAMIWMGKGQRNQAPEGVKSRIIIPFGPFLALGGVAALFWGRELLGLYLKLAGW